MFPERFESARLTYERLRPADLEEAHVLWDANRPAAHEEHRFLTGDPNETLKESFDKLREYDERWEAGTRAAYAIRPKPGEDGAGELAGTASLIPEWDRRTAITGLHLRKPFWGRGYSGERADRFLELAFADLGFEVVSPGYEPGNENSKRAIERYVERHGGRYDGLLRNFIPNPNGSVSDLHRYSITREEWAANR
jgi:ribosomal-protein-alanine N-acetyltransferase